MSGQLKSEAMTDEVAILQEASEMIVGERLRTYGDATEDFTRQAKLWTVALESVLRDGAEITARHIAMCMICTKMAREIYHANSDNRLDIIGYAALLEKVTQCTLKAL